MQAPQKGKEGILLRVGRREVGMPPLRGDSPVTLPVPDREGLAEARPRRDDGPVCEAGGRALPNAGEIRPAQERQGRGGGLDVVEQRHRSDAERLPDAAAVDDPRQVCDLRASLQHRPGHGQDRLGCRAPRLAEEMPGGFLQAVEIGTAVDGLRQGPTRPALPGEETEADLGAADVTGQQHASSSFAVIPAAAPGRCARPG